MATHAPGRTEPSNPSIEVVHRAEESAETVRMTRLSQTQVMKMWYLGRTQPAQQRRPSLMPSRNL